MHCLLVMILMNGKILCTCYIGDNIEMYQDKKNKGVYMLLNCYMENILCLGKISGTVTIIII